jgi:hypothetical protein
VFFFKLKTLDKQRRRDTLKSGYPVYVNGENGTIGCFVESRKRQAIISCKHVFQDRGAVVYSPLNGDHGNPIGRVEAVIIQLLSLSTLMI